MENEVPLFFIKKTLFFEPLLMIYEILERREKKESYFLWCNEGKEANCIE